MDRLSSEVFKVSVSLVHERLRITLAKVLEQCRVHWLLRKVVPDVPCVSKLPEITILFQ